MAFGKLKVQVGKFLERFLLYLRNGGSHLKVKEIQSVQLFSAVGFQDWSALFFSFAAIWFSSSSSCCYLRRETLWPRVFALLPILGFPQELLVAAPRSQTWRRQKVHRNWDFSGHWPLYPSILFPVTSRVEEAFWVGKHFTSFVAEKPMSEPRDCYNSPECTFKWPPLHSLAELNSTM